MKRKPCNRMTLPHPMMTLTAKWTARVKREVIRKSRRCPKWTPGTYATMHKGSDSRKPKKAKDKSHNEQAAQKRLILHLEDQNNQMREKLAALEKQVPQQPSNPDQPNAAKIHELEQEIECLINQIQDNDNDESELERTKQEINNLTNKIDQANAIENQMQVEIDNLKITTEELQQTNHQLTQDNKNLQAKVKEANKKAKKRTKP